MKVYLCKVYDGSLGEWVDLGVFSTCAKAMEYGSNHILAMCERVTLLDWDHNNETCVDWYQDTDGNAFTRVVTETEIDQGL